MYSSGLRVGEVVALKVKDIDSTKMQMYIAQVKNGCARYSIMSNRNLKMLRHHVLQYKKKYGYKFSHEDYLFPYEIFLYGGIEEYNNKNKKTKLKLCQKLTNILSNPLYIKLTKLELLQEITNGKAFLYPVCNKETLKMEVQNTGLLSTV